VQVIVNDVFGRPGDSPQTVVARVHPDNVRSLRYCQRIGLLPGGRDSHGLVICSWPLPPSDDRQLADFPQPKCERCSVSSAKYSGGGASSVGCSDGFPT
jgi:hypothetical protein